MAWLPVKRLRVDSVECTETTALHIWAASPAPRIPRTEIQTFVGVHLPILKRVFQIKPNPSRNCCFCPMVTQRWPRSVLALMFSCAVKRTQILGFDPGADVFMSNRDDSEKHLGEDPTPKPSTLECA